MTHPSTLLLPVPYWLPATSTTSGTSATGTLPYSTALRMLRHDSCRVSHTWRRRPSTRRNASKRISTGRTGMSPRKMALAVAADATLTLSMSKARKGLVWPSGWMLRVAGRAHKLSRLIAATETLAMRRHAIVRGVIKTPEFYSSDHRYCLGRRQQQMHGELAGRIAPSVREQTTSERTQIYTQRRHWKERGKAFCFICGESHLWMARPEAHLI